MSHAFICNSHQQDHSEIILKHQTAYYKTLREYLADPNKTHGDIIMSVMPMIFANIVLGQVAYQTMHLEGLDNYVEMHGGLVSIFLSRRPPSFEPQYLVGLYALAQFRIRDFGTLETMKEHLMGSLQQIQELSMALKDVSTSFEVGGTMRARNDLRAKRHGHGDVPECISSYHNARAAMEDFLRHFDFDPSQTPSSSAAVFGLLLSFGLTLVEVSTSRASVTRFLRRFREAIDDSIVTEPTTKPPPRRMVQVAAKMSEVRSHLFYKTQPREILTAANYNAASVMAIMSKVRRDVFYELGTKESSLHSEVRICNALVHALKLWPAMSPGTKGHTIQHLRGWLLVEKEGTCTCAVAAGNLSTLADVIVQDWLNSTFHHQQTD